MNVDLPHIYAPPTEAEKELIHESVVTHDGFLYFHRIPSPTASTVVYSSSYLIQQMKETGYTRLVVDFTGRTMVNHELRRLMLKQMSPAIKTMKNLVIVLDGSSFRRVVLDFFVRAYLRSRGIDVVFCQTKDEAMQVMRDIVQASES